MIEEPLFSMLGPAAPQSPVVLAVPHAGRRYPVDLVERARVPIARLWALEDRMADGLVDLAVAQGATAIVARLARAAIDDNRDPREIDPSMIEEEIALREVQISGKVRSGLGLFPRSLPASGELWKRRMALADVRARIETMHIPYHRTISERLAATRAIFGAAVLIDCHSMPPLPVRESGGPVRIVIGDRFGASASSALIDMVLAVVEGAGLRAARNHPYPGGHSTERHGRPHTGVHALQIEFDRTLYLDASLDQPGSGFAACRQLLAEIAREIGAMLASHWPVAAE